MDRPVPKARRGLGVSLPEAVVGAWVVGLAGFVIIGADLMWTVAMGDTIRRDGAIPDGIPFASAPQRDWSNPAVVGDLLLSTVNSAGWWALTAFHLALVAGALLVVVADARRLGAGPGRLAAVVSVLVIGCASPFVVARYPSLSLVPFVVLVWVLRRQSERASRAVWWVPPLVVLWGNLHGAVLVGVAVLGVWVVAGRGPSFLQRALVGLASLSTLVLTSAGLRTPDYYLGVLRNEAAVRRTDLWAPPDLTHPLDVAMIVGVVLLLALAARSLVRWEWLVALGIAVATVSAARNGVWLLLFLAPVAAAGRRRQTIRDAPEQPDAVSARWGVTSRAVPLVVVASLVLGLVAWQLVEGEARVRPPGHELVEDVRRLADGRPVLAKEPEAETFAQAGITVWAANPVDAFPRDVQGAFLDFLHDCRVPDPSLAVAVVTTKCVEPLVRDGWDVRGRSGGAVLLSKLS